MSSRWWLLLLLVASVPLSLWISNARDPYRSDIVIAAGDPNSRFYALAQALAQGLTDAEGARVQLLETSGSAENFRAVREGRANFGLYQPTLLPGEPAPAVRFVANLYPQPLFLPVRSGFGFGHDDTPPPVVAIGPEGSGDYDLGLKLLEHLGLNDQVEVRPLASRELLAACAHSEDSEGNQRAVDAAILTQGLPAELVGDLLATGDFELIDVPFPRALLSEYLVLSRFELAIGSFSLTPEPSPKRDVETVSIAAQLIASSQTSDALVEDATELLHDRQFVLHNRLPELYLQGPDCEFSRDKPSFGVHSGANNFYEPELKPFLPPDFVEATEGVRSFIVSVVIAIVFFVRWLKERERRRTGSHLDKYMARLLEIEHAQLDLDQEPGRDDEAALQTYMDEVTQLRREALNSFSTADMTDEPGVDLFLEMSHALSEKISGKITRQRMAQTRS